MGKSPNIKKFQPHPWLGIPILYPNGMQDVQSQSFPPALHWLLVSDVTQWTLQQINIDQDLIEHFCDCIIDSPNHIWE
jgi:hypothetical protein